jgi:hypothetical protein
MTFFFTFFVCVEKEPRNLLHKKSSSFSSVTMAARARPVSLLSSLSVFFMLFLLPCLLFCSTFAAGEVAAGEDSSSSSSPPQRGAWATTPPPPPSIPPLPRADELCSLAKQYAVPLKLCSDENGSGSLDIDRGSLLAAAAAVVPSKRQQPGAANGIAAAAADAAASTTAPQSLDSLRQQLDKATIKAASYLAPPVPGSPEAAAPAAAEKNATRGSARERDFASPKTRGALAGAAASVLVVCSLLVALAGKKQKTGKWL